MILYYMSRPEYLIEFALYMSSVLTSNQYHVKFDTFLNKAVFLDIICIPQTHFVFVCRQMYRWMLNTYSVSTLYPSLLDLFTG